MSLITSASLAQLNTQPYAFGDFQKSFKPAPQHPGDATPKALGVEIWSNNFDNVSDWTIDNDGQSGAEFGWTIDPNVDGWYFGGDEISSTSGGNFAELNNGVPSPAPGTQALDVDYYLTIAASIDIPNLPANTANTDQVSLQFEQYGARFNDLQEVQISTDGGTSFTSIWNNDYHPVNSAAAPNNEYPDPETVSINLAPYIAGNAGNVKFRFHWTTNFAGSVNPNAWVTYGWMIDDVKLVTNPDNDLEAQVPYWGTAFLNYYQIPTTQTAPIDFTTNAFNNGIATQTNAHLTVDITGVETFSGVSQMANIGPNTYDSLVLTTPFTPATLGTYNVVWGVTQDQVDDVPANNGNPNISFDVTTSIYARDNNVQNSTNSNGGFGYEVGNFFDIWNDQDVYWIDVKLASGASGTQVGSIIYGKIYLVDFNAGSTLVDMISVVGQTNYFEITAANLTGMMKLPLLAPVSLTANTTYLVVIASDGDGGASSDVVCAAAGTSDPQTSFFYAADDDTWYYTTRTPMVRLDFAAGNWGINEIDGVANFNVYPNPATDNVTISYALESNSAMKVSITDLNGNVIETISSAMQNAGIQKINVSTESYAAGVYFVQIENENGVATTKFVKQ